MIKIIDTDMQRGVYTAIINGVTIEISSEEHALFKKLGYI